MSQIEYHIFLSSCFSTTFAIAPLRLGSHGQLIEAIIVDSIFKQWCPKQNPHPMFLWLLCAMHHTFPAICPLNILWAAPLLQSHQFLHRKTEGERKRESEIYYSGLLQFVPTRIRVWNNCPPPVSSDNYATKPFECFIFFSFHWFILSPSSMQLLWTPVGRKTAVIKSQLLHLWSLINDVGEQARRAAGCNHWGVVTG